MTIASSVFGKAGVPREKRRHVKESMSLGHYLVQDA